MDSVHMVVGTLVIVAYLALTATYGLQIGGSRRFSFTRQLSMGAATLLLVQYALGFGLLGGSHSITPAHYLIALAAILPVGYEHMVVNEQKAGIDRARLGALAAACTTILVLIAYAIAESR